LKFIGIDICKQLWFFASPNCQVISVNILIVIWLLFLDLLLQCGNTVIVIILYLEQPPLRSHIIFDGETPHLLLGSQEGGGGWFFYSIELHHIVAGM